MKSRSLRLLSGIVPLLVAGAARAAGPADYDAYSAAPRRTAPVQAISAAPARVTSIDEKRGTAKFLWAAGNVLPAAATLSREEAALGYLAAQTARYGASAEVLSTLVVERVHDTGRGGVVVLLHHEVSGVPLFHHDIKVVLARDNSLVAIAGALDPFATPLLQPAFAITEADALAGALSDLFEVTALPSDLLVTSKRTDGYLWFDARRVSALRTAGFAARAARARPILYALPDRLVSAYYVELGAREVKTHAEVSFAYVIEADDGAILHRQNLTHSDAFSYRVWADPVDPLHRPLDGPIADFTPHPTGVPDGSYPAFIPPSLITMDGFNTNPSGAADPWLPPNATDSEGNNVLAYTDDDMPDGFSTGDVHATTTSAKTFDRVYDVTQDPRASTTQRMAAVTQIFYTTNWLHDWWYDSGFDETSKNAQQSNFGRGGVEGDPLLGEAQNGAPMEANNSNMSVPRDGMSPRMQMFVWDGKGAQTLHVAAPPTDFVTAAADFGPQSFNVTGLLHDQGDDGCSGVSAAAAGKVVLVDRGTCTFKSKTAAAQAAGAIGVIIVDNRAEPVFTPMADDPAVTTNITTPAYGVLQADGAALRGFVAGGATVTMARTQGVERDADVDATVVAHEWGHYLHLRHVDCQTNQCLSQSEGWGDFNALMLVVRPGDDLGGTFALAQYSVAAFPDDPAYFGIRRYPYSTNLGKSPLTFKYIADSAMLPPTVPVAANNAISPNSEVHAAGEIWAAMLFEGFTALLGQSLGGAPRYSFDEARRRMGDYVVAGLASAPPDPTFTEQRDAILAATYAADPADALLLAQGFAKRGAGTCAVSPTRDDQSNEGVKEDFSVSPILEVLSLTVDDSTMSCDHDGHLDFGEVGQVTVKVLNSGYTPITGAQVTITTTAADAVFPNGAVIALGDVAVGASAVGAIPVKLTQSPPMERRVSFTATPAEGCADSAVTISALIDADEVPNASATDDVEATSTAWLISGVNADNIWSRVIGASGSQVWQGIDLGAPSDTKLVSPKLQVSATDPLIMSFTHSYSFENSPDRMGTLVYYDGGVIEVSEDGTNWLDISMYGSPGYNGMIGDPTNMATNTLKGRQGYVATNPSNPATDKVTIDLGSAFAGKTIQVRFRIGSDDASGAPGWQLDDIGFQGITNEPFAKVVDDSCEKAPNADAGPDQTVTSGDVVSLDGSNSSDPNARPLAFAWTETVGSPVTLSAASQAKPKFTAPDVQAITELDFQLTVDDGSAMASDSVSIFVHPRATTSNTSSSSGITVTTVTGVSSSSTGVAVGAGGSGGGAADTGSLIGGGGCGCHLADDSSSRPAAAAALALAALLAARRRRASAG